MTTYNYKIAGTAADGQTWSVKGSITLPPEDGFPAAYMKVMTDGLARLTEGKAAYGHPGPCGGPYKVTELHITAFMATRPESEDDKPVNQVFRDPATGRRPEDPESFRVFFNGRVCSPDFNSKGAAAAYLQQLENGRKPEYAA